MSYLKDLGAKYGTLLSCLRQKGEGLVAQRNLHFQTFAQQPRQHRRSVKGSMWRATREKKAAKKSHSGNFDARHVTPDEHYLGQAGLRGRKRWIYLAIFILVYLLVTAHLVLTCFVLGVLRFDATGPPYFIFNSGGSLVWPQGANITDVRVLQQINAYRNRSLEVSGQSGHVFQAGNLRNSLSSTQPLNSSQVRVSQSDVSFHPFKSLAITSGTGGDQLLFSVNSSHTVLDSIPPNLQLLRATRVATNNIKSDSVLATELDVNGVGGVSIGGRQVSLISEDNLSLAVRTNEASVKLAAASTLRVTGLPVIPSADFNIIDRSTLNYHVCVCPNGRLFRVPAHPRRCAAANELVNPCT